MPAAQRDAFAPEMQAAGAYWRLVVYGGALHAVQHPPVDLPAPPGSATTRGMGAGPCRNVLGLLAECLPDAGSSGRRPDACPGPPVCRRPTPSAPASWTGGIRLRTVAPR